MSEVAILGSGFGLYGYLPAMVDAGAKHVVLPVRYQTKLALRPELAQFSGNIKWTPDENQALTNADSVVIALRPDLQAQWVSHCLMLPNIERLLLEKPLAPTPESAASLFDDLVNSRKSFRIGYLFRFTPWGERLLRSLNINDLTEKPGKLFISWNFLAHHFRHNSVSWKRYHSSGGGALRFYGIHLIALLAELGYTEISSAHIFGSTTDEIAKWSGTFTGLALPDCEVMIDTKSFSNKFWIDRLVNSTTTTIVSQAEPFGDDESASLPFDLDKRVSPLSRLCNSLWDDSDQVYGWYQNTIYLWRDVEARAIYERC